MKHLINGLNRILTFQMHCWTHVSPCQFLPVLETLSDPASECHLFYFNDHYTTEKYNFLIVFVCCREVGYRLSFCRRPLLKQSAIVSGPLDLEVAMRVSAPIDLRAVQVYSRIYPPYAIHKSNIYSEKLEIEILDETGKLLTYSHFNDKVRLFFQLLICEFY